MLLLDFRYIRTKTEALHTHHRPHKAGFGSLQPTSLLQYWVGGRSLVRLDLRLLQIMREAEYGNCHLHTELTWCL